MSKFAPDALVISDGSLASLVAVWRERVRAGHDRAAGPSVRVREELDAVVRGRESAGPAVWRIPGLSGRAAQAAARQAELAGMELCDGTPVTGLESPAGMAQSGRLLAACAAAIERGLTRVVWPVHIAEGPGASDKAVDAMDRAAAVSALAAIDLPRHGGPASIRIETPVVELSDEQLLELALDLDAPVPRVVRGAAAFGEVGDTGWACWWCTRDDVKPCGVCGPCGRWGVVWGRVDPAGVLSAG